MNRRSMRRTLAAAAALTALTVHAPAQCPPVEEAKILPPGGGAESEFGTALSLDGDTLVVGAPKYAFASTYGAVLVFERNNGGTGKWGQKATLRSSDIALHQGFGYDVELSGDTLVVGNITDTTMGLNSGAAYVLERDLGGPGNWGEVTKLVPLDLGVDDRFGFQVTVWGDHVAVAAPRQDSRRGAVYVFERDSGGANNWGQVAKLVGEDQGDGFGQSVALSAGTLAVSAHSDTVTQPGQGSAYVFERAAGGGGAWGLTQKVVPLDPIPGHQFGYLLDLDGDTLIVGAPGDDEVASFSGAAYAFERDAGGPDQWGQVSKLIHSAAGPFTFFGTQVELRGDVAIFGTILDGIGGAAYLFGRHQGGAEPWGEVARVEPDDVEASDQFGHEVTISGTTAVISAGHEAGLFVGSCYVFDLLDVEVISPYCTAGVSASGCIPRMTATGLPSASGTQDFEVAVVEMEGSKLGLLFYGVAGPSAQPWGSGSSSFLCVAPPTQRTGSRSSGGTPGACDGTLTLDWDAWAATHPGALGAPFSAGQTLWVQGWYRDPPSPKGTSLSDALAVTLCP